MSALNQEDYRSFLIFQSRSLLLLGFLFLFCISKTNGQTNIAPVVMAEGDQFYCPLTRLAVVTDFDIEDPDDTEIEAFFVQITTGYERGTDLLSLQGSHPNITTTWDAQQGKLTIRGFNGGMVSYADLIAAVPDVFFESTVQTPIPEKLFSLSVGVASFLPLTGHYYEFVPDLGITWASAYVAAENRTYFGLKGYLVTITSSEEAQLAGEQAAGTGWIGGSDVDLEGEWKWVSGPEAGTVFWNGGLDGSSPNFAFWNTSEPNNSGDEDYAHITANSVGIPGSWNDLSNTGASSGVYQPKGYMMEYGGTPGDPVLKLSASTKISSSTITSTTDSFACGSSTVILNATASSGEVFWFDAETGGNLIHTGTNFTTPLLTETTTFYANGCPIGVRTALTATIHPLPVITASVVSKNCDEDGVVDGFTDFNLNEITPLVTSEGNAVIVTYHQSMADATAELNAITPVSFNNSIANVLYARVENNTGCFEVAVVNLEVTTTAFPTDYTLELNVCDEDERDGFYSFDLRSAAAEIAAQFPTSQNLKVTYYRSLNEARLEQNEIRNSENYRNETAFSELLYVRVESEDNGDCFGIGPHLLLKVEPLVVFEVPLEASFCLGDSIVLEALNAQENYNYSWTNAQGDLISDQNTATIFEGGQYTVVATTTLGCTSLPALIEITQFSAPNLSQEIIVVEDRGNTGRIIIQADDPSIGTGNYEFALDDPFGPFQDEPIFERVLPGLHTLYAVDKNGCGTDQIEIGVVGVPKFLTPNNDGANDTLAILGVTNTAYNKAELFVLDRYGKLLSQIDAFGPGWGGEAQGNEVLSAEYWYVLLLTDTKGAQHKRTGHFSLIR